VLHAVQHWQNHRRRADVRANLIDRCVQLVGLHGQEDGIEGIALLSGEQCFDGDDCVLVPCPYGNAVRNLPRATWTNQKCDVASRRRQPSAKIPTDTAGTDNE